MTPGRWCLLVVIAVVVVAWSVWPEHSTDNPQYDALVKAHTRAIAARDSVRTVASEARKENVVQRRKYTEARQDYAAARSVTPPAFVIDTATIHINTESYTVPRPVAEWASKILADVAKADTLAVRADTGFVRADTALATTVEEVAAADTVSVRAEQIVAVLQVRPSFLARMRQAVKLPLAVAAAFYLGRLSR